jgi:hypothetical protein
MNSRKLTEKEIQDLARFLSGEMDEAEITALRTLLIKDLSFRKEVERLASIETSLSDALAVFESKSAPLIQPPGWAIANLDRTISHSFKRSKEGSYLDFFKDIRGFRLAITGFSCLLLAAFVILFSRNNAKENEFAGYDKEIQNLVKLSPSAFLAQSSESQQFRSTSKQVLSPNGLTHQHDPYLILSPRLRNNNYNVEVIDLLDPATMPHKGTYKGKPEPLSLIIKSIHTLIAERPYKIRIFSGNELIAEDLFKMSSQTLHLADNSLSHIQQAYLSLNDTPPRPGDAIYLIETLPKEYEYNQAAVRVAYLVYRVCGDEDNAKRMSQLIK